MLFVRVILFKSIFVKKLHYYSNLWNNRFFFLAADKSYITVIMASVDAFRLMKSEEWDAVKEMLSKGHLSKADLEEQHGVR